MSDIHATPLCGIQQELIVAPRRPTIEFLSKKSKKFLLDSLRLLAVDLVQGV